MVQKVYEVTRCREVFRRARRRLRHAQTPHEARRRSVSDERNRGDGQKIADRRRRIVRWSLHFPGAMGIAPGKTYAANRAQANSPLEPGRAKAAGPRGGRLERCCSRNTCAMACEVVRSREPFACGCIRVFVWAGDTNSKKVRSKSIPSSRSRSNRSRLVSPASAGSRA